jgi:hypothetical protein
MIPIVIGRPRPLRTAAPRFGGGAATGRFRLADADAARCLVDGVAVAFLDVCPAPLFEVCPAPLPEVVWAARARAWACCWRDLLRFFAIVRPS